MHPRRSIIAVIASSGLGLAGLSLLGGCTDESKTTGTQVQLSEEDKAMIEQMRGVMKSHRSDQKTEQIEDRKAKKKP